jgi:hypothetical protein
MIVWSQRCLGGSDSSQNKLSAKKRLLEFTCLYSACIRQAINLDELETGLVAEQNNVRNR